MRKNFQVVSRQLFEPLITLTLGGGCTDGAMANAFVAPSAKDNG